MKRISLKLQEQLLNYQKSKIIEEQIVKESKLVSEDSLNILNEFESLEYDIRDVNFNIYEA